MSEFETQENQENQEQVIDQSAEQSGETTSSEAAEVSTESSEASTDSTAEAAPATSRYSKGSNYAEMVKAANAVGIDHSGLNKGKLADLLNAKRDEVGHNEFDARVDSGTPASSTDGAAQPAAAPAASTTVQAAATSRQPAAPREAAAKWFEGKDQPWEVGDILDVIGEQILTGRQIKATRPAPGKSDAWKGHLYNMKDGSLQNTEVTINMVNLVKAADQTGPLLKQAKTVVAPAATATATTTVEAPAEVAQAPENPESEKQPETSETNA